jgi:predicted nucleic acid-binding Zn finger protein
MKYINVSKKSEDGLKGYAIVQGNRGEYIVSKGTIIKTFKVWRCTCPAYAYSNGKECKHIKAVKASLARGNK